MKKAISILVMFLLWAAISATAYGMESFSATPKDLDKKIPASSDTAMELSSSESMSLAVTGDLVWHIRSGQIYCEDPQAGQVLAALPLSALLSDGEVVQYCTVTSWSEDSVLLLLCVNGKEDQHLALLELCLHDSGVVLRQRLPDTKQLDFLFGKTEWNQVDIMAVAQQLYIAALDPELDFQLFLYTPEGDALRPLGKRRLNQYSSATPYGKDVLLAGPNQLNINVMELTLLSLEDGSMQLLRSVPLDYPMWFYNFAWSEEENLLYFTMDNVAYRMTLEENDTPEAFATISAVPALLHMGAVAGERYAVCGEEGQLLSVDTKGTGILRQLKILDTVGVEQVSAAIARFGVENPETMVTVLYNSEETDIPGRIQDAPEQLDAFIVRLDSDDFRLLCEKGLAADLSESELLRTAAGNASKQLRAALERDGQLVAFPLSVENLCQLLNVPALSELAGLSREKIPTDWPGFLKLLQKLAKKGSLVDNSDYRLYQFDLSMEEFREMLFSWLIQDCYLWVRNNPEQSAKLNKTALSALKEFNKVNWTRLGLSEYVPDSFDDYSSFEQGGKGFSSEPEMKETGAALNSSGGFTSYSEDSFDDIGIRIEAISLSGTPILSDGALNIEVMLTEDGEEFWPLSLQPGGDRLIAQSVTVICVNPLSPNRDEMVNFIEFLWKEMNTTTKMTIDQSLNEPVVNQDYQEDIDYFNEMINELRRQMRDESDPMEKSILNAELQALQRTAELYKEVGYWTASEESIAYYRSLSEQMVPAGDLWNDPDMDDALIQFLTGRMAPKPFLKQLTEVLK